MNLKFCFLFCAIAILSACSDADFKMHDDGNFNSLGVHVLPVSQDITVSSDDQVDILFVVDNSKSMAQEQLNFASKVNGFMDLVKDLDWHIALTTTDPREQTVDASGVKHAWGDGQFRPFDSDTGSLFVLKAGDISLADAQTGLARAIEVGLLGSGDERAVNATYRSIERIATNASHADFFRPKARLAVIAISDENECSKGTCLSTLTKSVPENLVSFVQSTWGRDKIFTFNSIARMSDDSTCTKATVASVYETMSRITDGITGSVCATDYTAILSKLGQRVVDLVDSVQLSCVPEDMDGDGVGDVVVIHSDGTSQTSGFTVNGKLLMFSVPLTDGSHRFNYHCMP